MIERDPPGRAYGWAVEYWDNLLDTPYRKDSESAEIQFEYLRKGE